MPVNTGLLAAFLAELRRRKVVQVALAYVAIAWLAMQFCALALDAFEAPGWAIQLILVIIFLGFPVVLALSWIFDLTHEGLLRTAPRDAAVEQHDILSVVMVVTLAD